ncbi:MAG: hypothetical protein GY939_19275 [Actinomycetia bacterium]|nr:hypothetical protein [Actinomycetes bacterium]
MKNMTLMRLKKTSYRNSEGFDSRAFRLAVGPGYQSAVTAGVVATACRW